MLDPKWQDRAASADDVMQHIQSNQRVFIHGAAATPLPLLDAMVRRNNVENVRLYHLHTEGDCAFAQPEHQGRFRSVSLFTGGHLRKAVEEGRGDFIPVFLSDIPDLFREGTIPLDVAVVQLSLPDRHGMCSLGTSVDAARLAFVSGGDHDGSSGIIRKDRMVNGSRRVRPSLWAQVNSHLCAGTKVFAFCLGVVAFIAVV